MRFLSQQLNNNNLIIISNLFLASLYYINSQIEPMRLSSRNNNHLSIADTGFFKQLIDGLPKITRHPQSAIVAPDSHVELFCDTNVPNAQVSWYYNRKKLNIAHDVNVDENNKLILNNFGSAVAAHNTATSSGSGSKSSPADGTYHCELHTPMGTVVSLPAQLSLAMLSDFEKTESKATQGAAIPKLVNIRVAERSTAVLKCPLPNGRPTPTPIFYTPRGSVISANSAKYVLLPSGNLYIKDVQMSDEGRYKCAAQNPLLAGTRANNIVNRSTDTFLTVVDKNNDQVPLGNMSIIPPNAVTVLVGSNLTLECTPDRLPGFVVWEKFGEKLPESRSHYDGMLGILEINNVRLSDRGAYICRIYSEPPFDSQEAPPTTMHRTLVQVEELPKFNQPYVLIPSRKGETIHLPCRTDRGVPSPETRWLFNSVPIRKVRGISFVGTTLTISNVNPKRHDGVYQCTAENIHGTAILTYHVRAFPIIMANEPSNVSIIEGKSLLLNCTGADNNHNNRRSNNVVAAAAAAGTAAGVNNNDYQTYWFYTSNEDDDDDDDDGGGGGGKKKKPPHRQITSSSDRFTITSTNALNIHNISLDDAGLYTCLAVNSITGLSLNTSQRVRVHSSHFKFEAEAIDSLQAEGYKVQQKRPAAARSPSSRNQQKQGHYHHKMKKGPSSSSVSITLTEIAELSSASPSDLADHQHHHHHERHGGGKSVVLKWDVLRGANLIKKFKVLYRYINDKDEDGEYFEFDDTLPSHARSYTMITSGIEDAAGYKFVIEAVTEDEKERAFSNEMVFDNRMMLTASTNGRQKQSAGNGPAATADGAPVLEDVWQMPAAIEQSAPFDGSSSGSSSSDNNNATTISVGLKWRYEPTPTLQTSSARPHAFKIFYKKLSVTDSNYNVVKVESSGKHNVFTHLLQGLDRNAKYEFRICALIGADVTALSNPVFMSRANGGDAETVVWMHTNDEDDDDIVEGQQHHHNQRQSSFNDLNKKNLPLSTLKKVKLQQPTFKHSQQEPVVLIDGAASDSIATNNNRVIYGASLIILASILLFLMASISFCVYRSRRRNRKRYNHQRTLKQRSRNRRHRCNNNNNQYGGLSGGGSGGGGSVFKTNSTNDRYVIEEDDDVDFNTDEMFVSGGPLSGSDYNNSNNNTKRSRAWWKKVICSFSTPKSNRTRRRRQGSGLANLNDDSLCHAAIGGSNHVCYCGSTVSGCAAGGVGGVGIGGGGAHGPSSSTTAPASCWTSSADEDACLANNSATGAEQFLFQHGSRCCQQCSSAATNTMRFNTSSCSMHRSNRAAALAAAQHRCSIARNQQQHPTGMYIDASCSSPSSAWPNLEHQENFYHTLNNSALVPFYGTEMEAQAAGTTKTSTTAAPVLPALQISGMCCGSGALFGAGIFRRQSKCCCCSNNTRPTHNCPFPPLPSSSQSAQHHHERECLRQHEQTNSATCNNDDPPVVGSGGGGSSSAINNSNNNNAATIEDDCRIPCTDLLYDAAQTTAATFIQSTDT